ncbi:MAG: alkyl sulfatase C-terminal domain-containing protein [Syntrophobacteraceae bacterium]
MPASPFFSRAATFLRRTWKQCTGKPESNEPVCSEDFSIEGSPRKHAALFSLLDSPDNNFPIVTP